MESPQADAVSPVGATYEIRRATPQDVPSIARFRRVMGGEVRSPEFYSWKYFESSVAESCVRIARFGDEVVGLAAVTFRRLHVGGEVYLCGFLGDLFTHPSHQRRGLMSRLTREVCEEASAKGARILYGTPNTNSLPVAQKVGLVSTLRIVPMMRILRSVDLLGRYSYLARAGIPLAAALDRWFFAPRRSEPPGVSIAPVSHFDESFDELWARLAPRVCVAMVREGSDLRARYATAPLSYATLGAWSDGRLVGYVVSTLQAVGELPRGYIVDWMTCEEPPGVGAALLDASMQELAGHGAATVWVRVIEGSSAERAFRRARYLRRPARVPLMFRTEGDFSRERLADAARWHFLTGDTDVV